MNMTSLELADNIAALVVAICYKDYLTPEEAFNILEGKRKVVFSPTRQDKEDMYWLRMVHGLTYAAIGDLYGINYNRTFKIIKNFKLSKKETLQGGNLSKVKG